MRTDSDASQEPITSEPEARKTLCLVGVSRDDCVKVYGLFDPEWRLVRNLSGTASVLFHTRLKEI